MLLDLCVKHRFRCFTLTNLLKSFICIESFFWFWIVLFIKLSPAWILERKELQINGFHLFVLSKTKNTAFKTKAQWRDLLLDLCFKDRFHGLTWKTDWNHSFAWSHSYFCSFIKLSPAETLERKEFKMNGFHVFSLKTAKTQFKT